MRFARLILLGVLSLGLNSFTVAQGNTDGMVLLGVAEYSELRRSYYLASLYADSPSSDAELLLETQGRRRMEIRVTSNRWSPRRFSQQWTTAVLINNEQEQLLKFDDNFVQFNSLLNEPFLRGDTIIIDSFDDGSSSIFVNGSKAFDVSRPGFLELLLSKWIGSRPPSTNFKNSILGATNLDLESSFASIAPTAERIAKTKRWFDGSVGGVQQSAEVTKVNVTAAPVVVSAPTPPPSVEVETAPIEAPEVIATDIAEAEVDGVTDQLNETAAVIAEPEPIIEEEEEFVIDPELYAQQQQTLKSLYQRSVARRILTNVEYPRRAIKRSHEDSFQMLVVVDRLGNVASVTFLKESKYSSLKKAAVEAVEAAGKMPPVPPSLDGDSVEIIVPFSFRLS